jgi:hypothetical protein
MWSGWDGVGTAAVALVGPIAYFTRACSTDIVQQITVKQIYRDFKSLKTLLPDVL